MTSGKTREEGERPGNRGAGVPARRGGNRRIGGFPFLLLAACCAAGAAGGVYLSWRNAQKEPPQGLVYEANVVSGDIPGKPRKERQREMDNLVEERILAMSMNTTPLEKVPGGDRGINWLIKNPSNQGKLIRVEIIRDDTGEKVYETRAVRPGNYVESVLLDAEFPVGAYECTAVFSAYGEETEASIGQATVKLTLTLQE